MKNSINFLQTLGILMIFLSLQTVLCADDLSLKKDWQVSSLPDDPTSSKLEITVQGYPDTIQFGDSVYLICTFKNVGEQPIENIMVSYQYHRMDSHIRYLRCDLFQDQDFEEGYPLLPEDLNGPLYDRGPVPTSPLLPGESRVMCVHTFEIPPLEDISTPFWETFSNSPNEKKYTMRFSTKPPYKGPSEMNRTLRHDLILQSRSDEEMQLLHQWMSRSKKEHLPVVQVAGNLPAYKRPSYERRGDEYPLYTSDDGNKITIRNKPYTPWQFIRLGNRKPPAHLCPTTWEGWRELEESLSESTMRDEIRLTRILIQYCATQDAKVLEELKTWFAGMNDVQRTCMAKSVLERARKCYGNDVLLVPFRELYKTIREYDMTTKSEYELEHLKNLELIE